MEMSKLVPNFIHVQGHWVMVQYCGMRELQPVQPGGQLWPRVQDPTVRPIRSVRSRECRLHGALPPVWLWPCDHRLHPAEKLKRKEKARKSPESLVVDFDPSILTLVPPPPCTDPLSSTSSNEDASAASSFEATTSVPAAIDSSQDTDVLNLHLKRLVIIEGDGNVTPGQGDLLSTHALPASATSGKSSRLCIG